MDRAGHTLMNRPTILLIDDDAEDLGDLAAMLVAAGFETVAVRNGREALHYLTSGKTEPAIIVTDLAMPDMSGWEFINILQAYVRLSVIPLVVVSGVDLRPELLARDSVAQYFRKPIVPKKFIEGLRGHLKGERKPAAYDIAADHPHQRLDRDRDNS
jgi:CheY-like chemotaxis protein